MGVQVARGRVSDQPRRLATGYLTKGMKANTREYVRVEPEVRDELSRVTTEAIVCS